MARQKFDHEIFLLQGGGALGSYHAGVYEGLAETGHTPTWVVGVSIGAIMAALIAGNPPERRIERLRAFWERVSAYAPQNWPAWLDPMRPAFNFMSASAVAVFGCPGFFVPRVPPSFLIAGCAPAATSFYDSAPLRKTLEELVDFDLINSRKVRISLGAVNVRTGESIYFDNHKMQLRAEHVMASGALPPGFPAVQIEGEYYWDGGIVSNSPLTYVWEEKPLTTALIVQIDLFNARGEMPTNLDQVLERHKDIQYSSKQRVTTERIREMAELRGALMRLLAKLPAKLRADADAQQLAAAWDNRQWMLIRLINRRLPHVSQTKDYEFSRATVNEHWVAGLEDIRHAAAHHDWLAPNLLVPGLQIHDLASDTHNR